MKGVWKLSVLFLPLFVSLKFFHSEKLERSNAARVGHQTKTLARITGPGPYCMTWNTTIRVSWARCSPSERDREKSSSRRPVIYPGEPATGTPDISSRLRAYLVQYRDTRSSSHASAPQLPQGPRPDRASIG